MQANKKNKSMLAIYMLLRSKGPKTQQTCSYRHMRKTSGLFHGTARVSTFAPAIILLTWVPSQNFPFPFNPWPLQTCKIKSS